MDKNNDARSKKAHELGVRYAKEHRCNKDARDSEELYQWAQQHGCPMMYFDVFKYGAQSVWRERGEIE